MTTCVWATGSSSRTLQFGEALQRILQCLAYCNPQFGPPLLAKIDLADGYYRIPLSPQAALALAVILPLIATMNLSLVFLSMYLWGTSLFLRIH
jgi:hypothetical protein